MADDLYKVDRSKLHNYKRGSILKIELNNFMIYKNVVLVPGSFLNLVLGPNGSGKSAIVCAIIMGFGGDPAVTGRSSNLVDYIRYGTQTATIHIEMYAGDETAENLIIERQLRSVVKNGKNECQSAFKLNNRVVQKAAFIEFIKSLNIDINNLCQVLPQERVVEFSRLTPKQLLTSTEKSIGDVNMYDRHMALIQLSGELFRLEQKIDNCNAFIMKYQNYKSNIEPDLRLIQQKKQFEEEIEWLVKKKLWVQYEEKRKAYFEMKELYNKKKDEYNEAGLRLKPIQQRISNCTTHIHRLQGQKAQSAMAMKQSFHKIDKCVASIVDNDKEITREIDQYNEMMKNETRNRERLVRLEADKKNFESELENTNDDEQFEAKVAEIQSEIEKIEQEISQISTHINAKKDRLTKLDFEKRGLLSRKRELNDIFKQRLAKISDRDDSSRIACRFLENNREMFQGRVYPPIITQINVNRPEHVKYVESALGFQDMGTFLFEDRQDLQKFCEELENAHRIRVNVAMLPHDMEMRDCNRAFSVDQYQSLGVFNSVRDLFTAPEPVMKYLCKAFKVHTIPVGDDRTEQNIKSLMESSNFRRILTPKNSYNIVVSSYDHVKTTKMIPLKPPRLLNVLIDEREVKDIDDKLDANEKESAATQREIEQASAKYDKLKEERQMKRDVQQTFQQRKTAIELLQHRIRSIERQIEEVQKRVATVDQLKSDLSRRINELQTLQIKSLDEASKTIKHCVEHTNSEAVFSAKMNLIRHFQSQCDQQKASIETELVITKNQLKALEEDVKAGREAAKESRNKAKELTGIDFSSDNVDPEVLNKLDSLANNISEIDDSIALLRLRAQGIADVDESVLEDYQKYQREIAQKSNECDLLGAERKKVEDEIKRVQPLWLDSLNALVGQINDSFGKFMAHMDFSGEVYLFHGSKEYAFEDYGIKIKVKFRDAEPMKDLDALHQSGGERSVSTMVYMLSLQELANVPFRIVDEINQGMDDRNERLVFDLISEVSRRNSSQYFLLSPKLLPRLNYSAETTVHIIMNGPYIYANLFEQTKKLLKSKGAQNNTHNNNNNSCSERPQPTWADGVSEASTSDEE